MPNRYIVVFKDEVSPEAIEDYARRVRTSGGEVTHHYDLVFKGFSAVIPDSFLSALRSDSFIDYIEPDGVVTTQGASDGSVGLF
ncbi:hypothetical protein AX16_006194 [Volvariella volvacea WC 439]|nr:hypothetical protein AX16_006194 [Volvariella volvacea WC 439]